MNNFRRRAIKTPATKTGEKFVITNAVFQNVVFPYTWKINVNNLSYNGRYGEARFNGDITITAAYTAYYSDGSEVTSEQATFELNSIYAPIHILGYFSGQDLVVYGDRINAGTLSKGRDFYGYLQFFCDAMGNINFATTSVGTTLEVPLYICLSSQSNYLDSAGNRIQVGVAVVEKASSDIVTVTTRSI